jgi:hypothetical protein
MSIKIINFKNKNKKIYKFQKIKTQVIKKISKTMLLFKKASTQLSFQKAIKKF